MAERGTAGWSGLRLAVPLAGHLIPTAAIGYGVVLPAAGLSAGGSVGVGFAASLVGTVVTYFVGVRMARQCNIERRPGLIGRALSAQAAHPRGLLGWALGRLWVTETASANNRAIALLAVSPGDRALEVGFGPGRAVHELASRGARVTGIDPSPVMLAAARRRNAAAVRSGHVRLLSGHVDTLPVPDATVDAVLSVHTLYFWLDLADGLREIRRVLAVDGRLVLSFRPAGHDVPRRFDPVVYRVPTVEHVECALRANGFDEITVELGPSGIAFIAARAGSSPTAA